jgi:Ricin-type beta-trefoil lectin domain
VRVLQAASRFALGITLAAGYACSVADLTSGGEAGGNGGPSGSIDAAVAEAAADTTDSGGSDSQIEDSDDAGAVEIAWDASSWPGPVGAVRLENALNGKYLNASIPPADASTFTPGVPVVTWSYTGATNQCWTFQYLKEDDTYEIITDTGRCLDDPFGNADSGTTMQQYQCWLGANYNQRWYLVNNQGHLDIVGKASGKCLTSTSNQDGVAVYISDCSTSESLRWITSSCR